MTFRIHRRDTELRFVAKFGENWLLQSCRKVLWITTQKNLRSARLVPALILPKMGRSRPKFPERCHPSTRPRVQNLVQIGCVLPDLFNFKFIGARGVAITLKQSKFGILPINFPLGQFEHFCRIDRTIYPSS